jgi:hypothetical protein
MHAETKSRLAVLLRRATAGADKPQAYMFEYTFFYYHMKSNPAFKAAILKANASWELAKWSDEASRHTTRTTGLKHRDALLKMALSGQPRPKCGTALRQAHDCLRRLDVTYTEALQASVPDWLTDHRATRWARS